MAQGKMKVKANLPKNVKKKNTKGAAITKKKNCPVKSKKDKTQEAQKLKQMVTKTLNKAIEEDLRAKVQTNVNLSKAQEAVAKYHTNKPQ